jgi:hypothetical protein
MKTFIKFSLVFISAILLIACNNEQKKLANEKLSVLNKDSKSLTESCLYQYAAKYDELLTLDQASSIVGLDKTKADTSYKKMMKDPAFQAFEMEWEGNRKRKIDTGFGIIESPKPDYITLSGMKLMTLESFNKDFGVKTEAEIKEVLNRLDNAFDKALDQKSESKEANEAGKKVTETGVSKEEAKAVQNKISEGPIAKTLRGYQIVNGLGDAASWNTFDQKLNVLKDGVRFYLEVDINDDTNVNKVKAIKVAKLILAKCN